MRVVVLLLLLATIGANEQVWGAEVKKIHLTPAQCAAHELPPIDLSLDATGTAMMPFEFPGKGVYLRMSGPPGGPLMFEVISRPETLDQALATRFEGAHLEEAHPCKAVLAGKERVGKTFLLGQSLARTRWTALEMPGLAVLFGTSPGSDPLKHPHLAPLAASLKVSP